MAYRWILALSMAAFGFTSHAADVLFQHEGRLESLRTAYDAYDSDALDSFYKWFSESDMNRLRSNQMCVQVRNLLQVSKEIDGLTSNMDEALFEDHSLRAEFIEESGSARLTLYDEANGWSVGAVDVEVCP